MACMHRLVRFMDSSLWQSLPLDVLQHAIAWLPLPSIFRFRSVSKHWNTLLASPDFLLLWSSIPRTTQQPPWLAFSTASEYLLCFDFSCNHWFKLSLRFLPLGFPQCLAASAGGLFLIEYPKSSLHNRFHVCNPLTKSLVELPPSRTLESGFNWTGFAAEHDGKDYKVLTVGWGLRGPVVELYMSLSNSWEILDAYPFTTASPITHCDGLFYWFMSNAEEITMLQFDIREPECQLLPLPVHESGFHPRLLDCQGSLVMVGCSLRDGNYDSIGIWKLVKRTREWELVERMTWEMIAHNSASEQQEKLFCIDCVGVANWVCIRANGGWEEIFAYNLHDRSWRWLPSAAGFGCILMAGFPFEPNLSS